MDFATKTFGICRKMLYNKTSYESNKYAVSLKTVHGTITDTGGHLSYVSISKRNVGQSKSRPLCSWSV